MYSFTILQSMKCKESALCFRNVLFDSNVAKNLQNQTFISQFTQIKLIWLLSYSLKIKLRAFPDIILMIWFHKQTVILSHSMCSSKQCDMHFLLQILEIRNFVVGGEMTDRILLLLRVLGVLSLSRGGRVRHLLLPGKKNILAMLNISTNFDFLLSALFVPAIVHLLLHARNQSRHLAHHAAGHTLEKGRKSESFEEKS